MSGMKRADVIDAVRRHAQRVDGLQVTDDLMSDIGGAHFVLLGEATHGTFEFYRFRAELTRRLIETHGFDAVAVEADWPAALRASRYAQGLGPDRSAAEALAEFERFPRWMWRNAEIVRWLDWLRAHNALQADPGQRVGFFGLDLYSLRESMTAVVRYLDREDPAAAAAGPCPLCLLRRPRRSPAGTTAIAVSVRFARRRLRARRAAAADRAVPRTPRTDSRQVRTAVSTSASMPQQNARVVRNAEFYYRTMFGGRTDIVERARPPHGRDAASCSREHLGARRRPPGTDRRSGPTTRTSAMRAPPRSRGPRAAQPRPAGARAPSATGRELPARLHHALRHGHRSR